MRRIYLFLVVLLAAVTANAQVAQQFDLTKCKKYFSSGLGSATAVSGSAAKIVGVEICNVIGLDATSYLILFDSNSTTGITSVTSTTNRALPRIYISSVSLVTPSVAQPNKSVKFDPPIACPEGIVAMSNVSNGIEWAILYMPDRATRHYEPY